MSDYSEIYTRAFTHTPPTEPTEMRVVDDSDQIAEQVIDHGEFPYLIRKFLRGEITGDGLGYRIQIMAQNERERNAEHPEEVA